MTTLRVQPHMSHLVRKPTICICENKDADQLRGYSAKLISAFVFAKGIVQFLFYLNPKFQASSSFLCLYGLVCVGPVRKPHCWFSHEAAHILLCDLHLFEVMPTFRIKLFIFNTPGPLYNTLCYNRVLDIALMIAGPQMLILEYLLIIAGPQMLILEYFCYMSMHFTFVITRIG